MEPDAIGAVALAVILLVGAIRLVLTLPPIIPRHEEDSRS